MKHRVSTVKMYDTSAVREHSNSVLLVVVTQITLSDTVAELGSVYLVQLWAGRLNRQARFMNPEALYLTIKIRHPSTNHVAV